MKADSTRLCLGYSLLILREVVPVSTLAAIHRDEYSTVRQETVQVRREIDWLCPSSIEWDAWRADPCRACTSH